MKSRFCLTRTGYRHLELPQRIVAFFRYGRLCCVALPPSIDLSSPLFTGVSFVAPVSMGFGVSGLRAWTPGCPATSNV